MKKITKWIILLLILQAVAMFLMQGPFPFSMKAIKEVSGGYGVLDTRFSYSPETAYEYFDHYGVEGRTKYDPFQLIDLFYPLAYSLFLSCLLFLSFPKKKIIWLIPLVAALFDYIENGLLYLTNHHFPDINPTLIHYSSFCTSAKWTLILISILLILMGIFLRIRLKKNK
ncbi:MAG: hypothetical protein J7L89_03970 [Bacteroidales bacterium]|nr:hypothetical protein [Bacteroidales bacterium]